MLNKACFVDAHFKSMPFLSDSERKALHDAVVGDIESNMPLTNEDEPAGGDDFVLDGQEPSAKKKRKTQFLGDMFDKHDEGRPLSINEKADQELKCYLDEESPAVDDTHALKWWKEHHCRFPTIAKIAKKVLRILATSTASERLFSTAGHVINTKRACLDSENVNMLCFLAENVS